MAILRRYNNETKQWEDLASGDASGIYTDNAILTGDVSGNVKSVEDVLLKDRDDIEKLKRNVSWLALHGGGGSGGGGGSSVTATVSVLDPVDDITPIGTLVWSNDITHLYYRLSSNVKTTFTVTVKLNGNVIQTDKFTSKYEVKAISMNNLKKFIGSGGTLSIDAVDLSESHFQTTCNLIISSVVLNDSSLRVTRSQLESHESYKLRLTYRSNVYGRYKLYYCNTMIYIRDGKVVDQDGNDLDNYKGEGGKYFTLDIQDSNILTQDIDVIETGLVESVDVDPGTYNSYFLLVYEKNLLVRSSVASAQITVLVTDGILVSPITGSLDNPYTIALDGILPLQFAVYSNNSGTYTYSITLDSENIQLGDAVSGNIFNKIVTQTINISNYSEYLVEGNDYELTIRAFQGSTSASAKTKIRVISAVSNHLYKYKEDLIDHTILNYTFYDLPQGIGGQESYLINGNSRIEYTNNNYLYRTSGEKSILKASAEFKNIGPDSGRTNGVYYKLRHTACGEIRSITSGQSRFFTWFQKDNGLDSTKCLIPHHDYQFTLQVAYHINEEEDDNATILNMGSFDVREKTGHGIVITAHKLYFNLEKTYIEEDLQDNDFTQIDIVSEFVNNEKYWIRIYQNAKLLSTKIFEIDENFASESHNINSIFLGGKGIVNDLVQDSINAEIYSLKFYSKSLNVGQVVCSYINNFAEYNRTDQGLPVELITELCENNQINTKESELVSTSDISPIYNFKTGEYTWGISALGYNVSVPDSIKKLPIPIVTLSVNWSFDDFTSGRANSRPAENSQFTYKSANRVGDDYVPDIQVESTVKVEIQGTTSANYTIKNLDITFDEDTLFSPLATWFPENTFTLKADIVDSGHINNAVIGKFVNDCFNSNPGDLLMNVSECFPTVSKVKRLQQDNQLPPKLTVKATIEGFPILLIVNFKKGDSRDPRILGIYSFNLGRKSYYNHGYKVPDYLYKKPKNDGESVEPYVNLNDIVFPSLFGIPANVDIEFPGYCYEGQASHNCSISQVDFSKDQYDFVEIDMGDGITHKYPPITSIDGYASYNGVILKDKEGNYIPFTESRIKKMVVNPDGYFWSRHSSYWRSLWKFVADPSILNIDDADRAFANLNTCIATRLLYKKGTLEQFYGVNVDEYQIDAKGETITTSKTGSTFQLISAQSKEPVLLSVKNTSFYYVISMLFGLVDSLGKNLQMKYWGNGGSSYWSPTFYDMDTALGISNTGAVSVKPNVLDYSIFNTQNNKALSMFGQLDGDQTDIELFTVYSNKLWGIEHPQFVRQYSQDFNPTGGGNDNLPSAQFFAQMWHNLRTTVLLDPNEFFEKYFAHQFDGCGEFLINYDYTVKYLETAQTDFLHGNRLSFIKNWLEKRVAFLDSVFGFSQRVQSSVDFSLTNYLTSTDSGTSIDKYRVPWRNEVILHHNSGSLTLPVVTNRYVIMKVTVGGVNTSYTYVPSGVETNIIVAENVGTRDIQTSVNNSDCIVDFPDLSSINLTNLSPKSLTTVYNEDGSQKYPTDTNGNLRTQWGTFSSLKNLDLASLKTFSNDIDFFRLFKTWDTSVLGRDPDYFSLHSLDLSNMQTNSKLHVNLRGESGQLVPSTYSNPFINLTEINVSNSDINNVDIPEDVSLISLKISNSRIASLTLKQQPLLQNISFLDCKNLATVNLINCPNFKSITFDSSNVSLSNVIISNCENLETFTISPGRNNKYVHVPNVTLEGNNKLTSITIIDCENLPESELPVLTIRDCPKLSSINLTRSKYNKIVWDKATENSDGKVRLSLLNLNESTVKVLKKVQDENEDTLDLTGIYSIDSLLSNYNSGLEYVKVDNIEDSPFILNRDGVFQFCTNLKRVYGNYRILGTSAFYGCTNFSVLGIDTTSYLGVSMVDNEIIKHFNDSDVKSQVSENNRPMFQTSENSTNIQLYGANSGSYSFYGTSCTILDAYYILYNINSSVTNLNNAFRDSNIFWDWTNSPSRYMFSNCGNVLTVSGCFRGTKSRAIRLFSPLRTQGGAYLDNEPGIFTPLSKCKDFSLIFHGGTNYVVDKHLFRKNSGTFAVKNLSYFYPRYVIDDVSNITEYPTFESLNNIFTYQNLRSDAEGERKYGDLGGFFKQTIYLTNINGAFSGTKFINYDCFNDNPLDLPTTLTEIRRVFNSEYSYGTIGSLEDDESTNDFSKLFKPNNLGKFNIQGIYSCFTNSDSNLCASFNLSNGTFSGFSRVIGIGYKTDTSDFNSMERSFSGFNKKIIVNYFPYQIVPNPTYIQQFSGIFENSSFKVDYDEIVLLPGNMFEHCSDLIDVSYLFNNINFNYKIDYTDSEGNGTPPFETCKNLKNVSWLFSVNASGYNTLDIARRKNFLTGPIPPKLFYHGSVPKNISISGLTREDPRSYGEVSGVTISGNTASKRIPGEIEGEYNLYKYSGFENVEGSTTSIICVPTTSVLHEEAKIIEDPETGEPRTVITSEVYQWGRDIELNSEDMLRIDYNVPNATISNAEGLFQGADIEAYNYKGTYSDQEVEVLPTYQPYNYIKNSGSWQKVIPNNYKYTLMWVYDGRIQKYQDLLTSSGKNINEFEFLDDSTQDSSGDILYPKVGRDDTKIADSNNGYFCCAPDLLRYCTEDAEVHSIFNLCGQVNGASVTYNQLYNLLGEPKCYQYGLHGRIVPYLFKPTPRVRNLSNFFTGCKLLGWYSRGSNYTIPESLFKYITSSSLNLTRMFMGVHFPEDISLNVFSGQNREYNVTETFRYACFDATSSKWVTISNVFNDSKITISGLRSCFRVSESDTDATGGNAIAKIRSVYVNFLDNFKKGYYMDSDAYFVYDGYTSGTVNFGETRELPTDENRRNYRVVI